MAAAVLPGFGKQRHTTSPCVHFSSSESDIGDMCWSLWS